MTVKRLIFAAPSSSPDQLPDQAPTKLKRMIQTANRPAITVQEGEKVAVHVVSLSPRSEMLSWIRHPVRTLQMLHATLVNRTITANLERAREHAHNDNREGFVRHIGHAACLARRHVPKRITDVERVAQNTVDLLGDSTERTTTGSHGFETDA